MRFIKRIGLISLVFTTLILISCAGGIASQPPTPTAPIDLIQPTSDSPVLPPVSGLSGHLIYTTGHTGELHSQDLATNAVTILYQPPDDGRVISASVSPDGKNIVMAYAPAPGDGAIQFGYTDLMVMPAGGSAAPTLLLDGASKQEVYSWPTWSPDGKYLYFSHSGQTDPQDPSTVTIRVERMAYPSGQPEVIADQALWPRLSPDGSQLAYLSRSGPVDVLVISDPDGSNPRQPMPTDQFPAVDAPTFSPDGAEILFSAVESVMYHPGWLVEFLGVGVAHAHDVPSDLFKIPVEGGDPVRLTRFSDYGFYPAFSPDARHIAFMRGSGIYVMDPDGGNIARLHEQGPTGTLDWLR